MAAALLAFAAPDLLTAEARRVQDAMGGRLDVRAVGPDKARLEKVLDALFVEVDHWDRLLSTDLIYSDISHVNKGAGFTVLVSPDTAWATASLMDWARRTRGAFDPTGAPLRALWGFDAQHGQVPSFGALSRVREAVGFNKVEVSSFSVRLLEQGMALDFGAAGKAWALDRALEKMDRAGLDSVLVDFNGQQVFWSASPGGRPGEAQQPRRGGALFTSSDEDNYFVAPDVDQPGSPATKYSRLLDPRTGRPAAQSQTVTVWAPTAEQAAVLAEAIFVMGPEEGFDFAENEDVAVRMTYWDKTHGHRTKESGEWKKR